MLIEGRSFSGLERHVCFLNQGNQPKGTQFANISSVSGFDLIDDGRAMGVVDFDHDGDQDLWVSNRSAPRLRLLRNDSPSTNKSISIALEGNGTSTNRDGIGAKVELVISGSHYKRHCKTRRAGNGFASQSSRWLHFGLGKDPGKLEKILVRWPSGEEPEPEKNLNPLPSMKRVGAFCLFKDTGLLAQCLPKRRRESFINRP